MNYRNEVTPSLTQYMPSRDKSTSEEISLLMAELGRKGGKIGGKRRLVTMTKEERKTQKRRSDKSGNRNSG